MPETCVKLPSIPFDGQIYIDYQRIKWRWDAANEVWWRIGTADTIPLADSTTAGLMSAADKVLLDSLPAVGGAFGLIIAPQLVLARPWNPEGVIHGDITLHSDSFTIECVDRDGLTLTGPLSSNDPLDIFNDPVPGFRFSLSPNFLSTLCLEVYGPEGKAGNKGDTGPDGANGYTDSPPGEKGDPGRDASLAHTFTGLKIIELPGITDEAVVDLDMNQEGGILSYTVAKINVPENDDQAEALVVVPTERTLDWQTEGIYRTMDDWVLGIPPGDPLGESPELLLLQMPSDAHAGRSIEISRIKLTEYIEQVTSYYKEILEEYETQWLSEVKSFIESKDGAARSILASMAHELSECEWTRPLQFCMGIKADDCEREEPPVPTSFTTVAPTTEEPTTEEPTATTTVTTTATTTGTTGTTGTTATTTTGTGTTLTTTASTTVSTTASTTATTTTPAPTTTTPAPDPWCAEGTLQSGENNGTDYACVTLATISDYSHLEDVADCCAEAYPDCMTSPAGPQCPFTEHRLERSPGYAMWSKDMSFYECYPDQSRLYMTMHEDAARVWINVILENSSAEVILWWQRGLIKPVNCDEDFNAIDIPLKAIEDQTCGPPLSTGGEDNLTCRLTIYRFFTCTNTP